MTAGLTKSSSRSCILCWHHGKRGKPEHQGVKDMECAQTGYRMCRNETLRGLPWTVTPFASQANSEKSRGAPGKGSVAQWAHPWGIGQMRFLFLLSYRPPLSGGIRSTWMNMDNWPLNCQRYRKHLFNFFILCSDNWYINCKNVPEHSQSVKFPRFFCWWQPALSQDLKREKETTWIKELKNWVRWQSLSLIPLGWDTLSTLA